MTSTVDLLAALSAHLTAFEVPAIASAHLSSYQAGPPVTVQLSCDAPAVIAAGLLTWANTLTETSAEVWRVPRGDSVHLSVTGRLTDGTEVLVYGAVPVTQSRLGADLAPGATATLPLAVLRPLAIPGQATEEVTL